MASRHFSKSLKELPSLLSGLTRASLRSCSSSSSNLSQSYGEKVATSSARVYQEDMYDHLLEVYRDEDSVSVSRFMDVRQMSSHGRYLALYEVLFFVVHIAIKRTFKKQG